MATLLEIANLCQGRLQIPKTATFYATLSTDGNNSLLAACLQEALIAFRDAAPWPQFEKEYTFTLVNGTDNYALPTDFSQALSETFWNRTQRLPLIGPVDAIEWQNYKSGLIATLPRQRFRMKYYGVGSEATAPRLFMDPPPDSAVDGQTIAFEYISKNCVSNGSAGAEVFSADTDQILLEQWLVIDGTVWRFKKERNLDYQQLQTETDGKLEVAAAKVLGASVISFNSDSRTPLLIGPHSYPELNYGS